jgi:hypothetical protein
MVWTAGRDGSGAGIWAPPGTRTPAPQPLHRIFLPANSAFVEYFRPHAGQANLTIAAASPGPVAFSLGGGTFKATPQPPQATLWPTCESFVGFT